MQGVPAAAASSIVWPAALTTRSAASSGSSSETGASSTSIRAGEDLGQGMPLPHQGAERIAHQRGLDEQVASREMGQFLEKMIATLPEDIRNPLVLSTVQELNAGEIAELLGIPESSVRTRMMRARKLLKEKLSVLLEAKHG